MPVVVRPARWEEVPQLQAALNADEEQVPFARSVVFVAEEDGQVIAFIASRLSWVTEPLKLLPAAAALPKNTRRRATYGLAQAMEAWIGDRTRNRSGIHEYIFRTSNALFRRLARHWGCLEWFPRAKFFRRSL